MGNNNIQSRSKAIKHNTKVNKRTRNTFSEERLPLRFSVRRPHAILRRRDIIPEQCRSSDLDFRSGDLTPSSGGGILSPNNAGATGLTGGFCVQHGNGLIPTLGRFGGWPAKGEIGCRLLDRGGKLCGASGHRIARSYLADSGQTAQSLYAWMTSIPSARSALTNSCGALVSVIKRWIWLVEPIRETLRR